jgi:hypothetical protein
MNVDQSQQVEQALATLKSFRNGDFGVACAIACGSQAIPALRAVLFEREPSGLYQARCRAVEALAALGAHDVLIEFLETQRNIADPIERVGEDAVINAAALALANARDEYVFELLLRLANRPCLTGVIGALGAYRNVEAIPALINALEEDASRLTAEGALKKLGESARAALLDTVAKKLSSPERESESSARRRRSALRMLSDMGVALEEWPSLRPLMHDNDTKVAVLACKICLDQAPVGERPEAVRCLIRSLVHGDWMLREEIEIILVTHFGNAQEEIDRFLNEARPNEEVGNIRKIEGVLRRVIARSRIASNSAQPCRNGP